MLTPEQKLALDTQFAAEAARLAVQEDLDFARQIWTGLKGWIPDIRKSLNDAGEGSAVAAFKWRDNAKQLLYSLNSRWGTEEARSNTISRLITFFPSIYTVEGCKSAFIVLAGTLNILANATAENIESGLGEIENDLHLLWS